jgi:hypothetical protein
MLALLFLNMHKILCGDLVEILSNPACPILLGLVLKRHQVKEKWFFEVRYVEGGCTDTRWINEEFIKKA